MQVAERSTRTAAAHTEKGSVLTALTSLASTDNEDYVQNRVMSRADFIKMRKQDDDWSERTADREIADLKRAGIIQPRQVRGKYVFNVQLTAEQITTLPQDVRDDLDRGTLERLSPGRIVDIRREITETVDYTEIVSTLEATAKIEGEFSPVDAGFSVEVLDLLVTEGFISRVYHVHEPTSRYYRWKEGVDKAGILAKIAGTPAATPKELLSELISYAEPPAGVRTQKAVVEAVEKSLGPVVSGMVGVMVSGSTDRDLGSYKGISDNLRILGSSANHAVPLELRGRISQGSITRDSVRGEWSTQILHLRIEGNPQQVSERLKQAAERGSLTPDASDVAYVYDERTLLNLPEVIKQAGLVGKDIIVDGRTAQVSPISDTECLVAMSVWYREEAQEQGRIVLAEDYDRKKEEVDAVLFDDKEAMDEFLGPKEGRGFEALERHNRVLAYNVAANPNGDVQSRAEAMLLSYIEGLTAARPTDHRVELLNYFWHPAFSNATRVRDSAVQVLATWYLKARNNPGMQDKIANVLEDINETARSERDLAPVNLDTATLDELNKGLHGVGRNRARSIVAGRGYDSIAGILDVTGIGPETFLRNIGRLEVSPREVQPLRIGLNGFGDIGSSVLWDLILQAKSARSEGRNLPYTLTRINSRTMSPAVIEQRMTVSAYTHQEDLGVDFRYKEEGDWIEVVDRDTRELVLPRIYVSNEQDIGAIDWSQGHKTKVDVVFESTGRAVTADLAGKHIDMEAGPEDAESAEELEAIFDIQMAKATIFSKKGKTVLISAPGKGDIGLTFVWGATPRRLFHKGLKILSAASCTTNNIVPMDRLLDFIFRTSLSRDLLEDGAVSGIRARSADTKHGHTSETTGPNTGVYYTKKVERKAGATRVDTTTGATKTAAVVLPFMEGKGAAFCIRFPMGPGSVVDAMYVVEQQASSGLVNFWLDIMSGRGPLKGVLGYEKEAPRDLVALRGDRRASIILGGARAEGDKVEASSFYDNVMAFSAQMLRSAEWMARVEADATRGPVVYAAAAELIRPTTLAGALEKATQTYGLSVDSVSFTQVSGPVDDILGDPIEDKTLTASLHATNLPALSAHYTAGCALEAISQGRTVSASVIKKIADGGAVTLLEKTLKAMAEDLDITIIVGGSEGKTRDDSPALTVKQVINPEGKNGIYIVHADPIENTNSHGTDEPGAWTLFYLIKLPAELAELLRRDASNVGLQEFLDQTKGEALAKYKIPFSHDRYVISVSYPGNADAEEVAQFHPTDNPKEILQKIADEHGITLEELGRKTHVVFLERKRHNYIRKALVDLQRERNAITFTTVEDGDAFARALASLGMPVHKDKEWTIVFGASGAVEAYATGLVSAASVSEDGSTIGRVSMVHASMDISGEDLTGWNNYGDEQDGDLEDFDTLGITEPTQVITETEMSEYPETIYVASSITSAREHIDVPYTLPVPAVKVDGEYLEVSSFVVDEHGRSFLVTTRYKSSDPTYTRLSMRADNNYAFFDDESVDFAIKRLIMAATDSERKAWQERLVKHFGPEQLVARLLALIEPARDIGINYPLLVLNTLNDLVASDETQIVFIVKAMLKMPENERGEFEIIFTDLKNEMPQETQDAYSIRLIESVTKGLDKWSDFFASAEGDTQRAMGLIQKTAAGFKLASKNEPGYVTTAFPVEELHEVAPENKVDLTATDDADLVALMQPIERSHPYAPLQLVAALGELLGGTGSRYQNSLRDEPETIEEIEARLGELGKFARSFKSALPWGSTSHTILERQVGTNRNIGPVLAIMAAHNNHEEAVAFMQAVTSILEAKDGQAAPQVVSFAQPIVPWRVPTREDFKKAIETDNQSFLAFTPDDIEDALRFCEAHAGEIALDEEGRPYFSAENHWDFVKYFIELGHIFNLLEAAIGGDGQVHDVILRTFNQDDMGATYGVTEDAEGKNGYGTIKGSPRPSDVALRVLMSNLQGEGGFYEFLVELDEMSDEEWEAYRQTEEFRERFRSMKCGIIEGGRMVGYGTGGGIFDVEGSTQVVEKLNIKGGLPTSDITNSNSATKSLLAEALMIGLRPKDIREMIETRRKANEFSEEQQARVLRGLREVESRSVPVRRQIKAVGTRVAQGLNKDIHGAFGRTYGVILLVGHSISTYEHQVGDIDRALLRGEIDFNAHQEKELAIARFLTFVPVKHLGQWRAAQRVARSLDKYLGYTEETPVRSPEVVLAGLESQEPKVVLKALQDEGYYFTEEKDLPLIGEWLKRTVVEKLAKQPKEIVRDIVTAGLSPEAILDGISDSDISDDRLRSAKQDLLGLIALAKGGDYLAFQEKMLLFSKDFSYIFGEVSPGQQEIYHRMMIAKSILAQDIAIYYLDEANSGAFERLTQDAIAIMQDMQEAQIAAGKIKKEERNKIKVAKRFLNEWLSEPNMPQYIKQGIIRGMLEGRSDDLIFAFGNGWRQFGTAGIRNQAVNSSFEAVLLFELEQFAQNAHAPVLVGPNIMNAVTLLQQTATVKHIISALRSYVEENPEATEVNLRDLMQESELFKRTEAAGKIKLEDLPSDVMIALPEVFKEDLRNNTVTFSYDSRLNGKYWAQALAADLMDAGIKVNLFENVSGMPSLVIASKRYGSIFGFLISASHSEPNYNGFKFAVGYLMSQVDKNFQQTIMAFRNMIEYDDIALSMANPETDPVTYLKANSSRLTWLGKETAPAGQEDYSAQRRDFYTQTYEDLRKRSPLAVLEKKGDLARRFREERARFNFLYTAFSGAGAKDAEDLIEFLKAMGYEMSETVKSQTDKVDGRFPAFITGWKTGMPDPGNIEACATNLADYLLQLAGDDLSMIDAAIDRLNNQDLFGATDPDSDRAGMILRLMAELYPGATGNMKGLIIAAVEKLLLEKGYAKGRVDAVKAKLEAKLDDKLHLTANDAWMFLSYWKLRILEEQDMLEKDKLYVIIKSHVTTSGLEGVAEYYRKEGYNVHVVDTFVGFTLLAERADSLFNFAKVAWEAASRGSDEASLDTLREIWPGLEKVYAPLKGQIKTIDDAMEAVSRAVSTGKSSDLQEALAQLRLVANIDVVCGVEESNGYGEFGKMELIKGKEAKVIDEHIREKDGSLALYEFMELMVYLNVIEKPFHTAYLEMMRDAESVTATNNSYYRYIGAAGDAQKKGTIQSIEKELAYIVMRMIDRGEEVTFFNRYTLDTEKDPVEIFWDAKYDNNFLRFPEEGVRFNLVTTYEGATYKITVTYRPSGTGMENRCYAWVKGVVPEGSSLEDVEKIRRNAEVVKAQLVSDFFGEDGVETGYFERDEFGGLLLAMNEGGFNRFREAFARTLGIEEVRFTQREEKLLQSTIDFANAARNLKGKITPEQRMSYYSELLDVREQNSELWAEYLASEEAKDYPENISFKVNGETLASVPKPMAAGWTTSLADYLAGVIIERYGFGATVDIMCPGVPELAKMVDFLINQRASLYNILAQLDREDVRGQMQRLYGKSFEETDGLDASRMAEVGFETKKDGTKVNRLGWTVENLKWLLARPEKTQQVLADAETIRSRYKYVIFCGMGGSGLSVQTVKTTFGEPEGFKMFSLRTTDPAVIKDILDEIARDAGSLEEALSQTLIIPVSKSGTTQETVTQKAYFEKVLAALYSPDTPKDVIGKLFDSPDDKLTAEELKLKQSLIAQFRDHIWVITDKGSPMDTGAYKQREIQLNGEGDIGGRFTAPTTHVFLLPLALVAPERVQRVLDTAMAMNEETGLLSEDAFIGLGAYFYNMAANFSKDKVTFMVPEGLRDLPMWSEQLFEESLGKGGKGLSIFYGEDLSIASLKSVEENDRVFLRVNVGGHKTNDEFWTYLKENGYPVFEINVDGIDSIGGLMLGLQRAVATAGYLWDICFVDQPAVEGYKNATREVMASVEPGETVQVSTEWKHASFNGIRLYYDRLIEAGAFSLKELEVEVTRLGSTMDDAPAVYAAIINIVKSKPGFEAKELASYGRMTQGLRAVLERARKTIFTDGLQMPSKLGEGPDKNHAYHQSIEDGKDMWFSTYFMPLEVEQPEALEYDDNQIRAQAIGTVNSVANLGRKVVLITFDSTTSAAEGDVDLFFSKVGEYLTKTTLLTKSSRRQQTESMDQIIVRSASTIKDETEFFTWLASLPQNQAVVVIAEDVNEYKRVEYLKDAVYLKVVNGKGVKELGLEPYQVLNLKSGQATALFGFLDNQTNGIGLDLVNDIINEKTAEAIWSGV
ncbi:helix-hairpin-helix domain-containing protein [Candidatus Omnitrophota bacterium]